MKTAAVSFGGTSGSRRMYSAAARMSSPAWVCRYRLHLARAAVTTMNSRSVTVAQRGLGCRVAVLDGEVEHADGRGLRARSGRLPPERRAPRRGDGRAPPAGGVPSRGRHVRRRSDSCHPRETPACKSATAARMIASASSPESCSTSPGFSGGNQNSGKCTGTFCSTPITADRLVESAQNTWRRRVATSPGAGDCSAVMMERYVINDWG